METKYRWFYTSGNKLVLAGKNAEQNEQIIKEAKPENIILHTKDPGSPFCIISGKANEQDVKEAAVFCACFSQGWKKRKKEMEVHIFKGEQMTKGKDMKAGTFGVIGKVQKTKAKLELWLGIQKNRLRAAPKTCFKKPLIKISPGSITKEKAAEIIKRRLDEMKIRLKEENINGAIPAGGFELP
jgi:hypothetical protein